MQKPPIKQPPRRTDNLWDDLEASSWETQNLIEELRKRCGYRKDATPNEGAADSDNRSKEK